MSWIQAMFRRRRTEQILEDEVRHHIELQTEEYIRAGMTPEEAARAARLRFGTISSVQERCREQNKVLQVESVWQDLRFAFRTFSADKGFTAVVLITLALGIGANTAVFSFVRAVLLEPLPVRDPGRVVFVWETDRIRGTQREAASWPDYLDMRQRAKSFETLAASQPMDVTLTGYGEPERVPAARVTSNFFQTIGVDPVLGRVFRPGEDGVILSHSLWQSKFGGSPDVLGRAIYLDGFTGTILGVMAPEANSLAPRSAAVWTALETVRATMHRGQHQTRVLGRLRSSATVRQAQTEMTAIMAQLEKEYPRDNLGRGATVVPLHEELAGRLRPALTTISAAVVVLLLIACLNVANLLLARASARGRELAVRVSLGADRWRLARQLLTESLLLAVAGAAVGAMVASWGVRVLVAFAPADMPLVNRAAADGTTLLVTLGVSLLAWLIFGVVPALRASATPESTLRASARTTAPASALRLRNALVMVEIGMATVLVIFTGVLIRSFWRLHEVDLGYEPRGAMTLRVKLPESRYPFPQFPFREWPAAVAFYDRLKTAVAAVPGVEAASLAIAGPDRDSWTTRVTVAGRPVPPEGEQDEAQYRPTDTEYLNATGATLLRGRFFEGSDDERRPLVAVLNEAFVKKHFPGEDPIGRHIVVFGIPRQVVGVMNDIRYGSPDAIPTPAMYIPLLQAPFPDVTLTARFSGDPAIALPAIRSAVLQADPAVAPFDVMTLEGSLSQATSRQRFVMSLLGGFGFLALALAAVGIYGVVAYSVGQRRQEFAIRLALGARAVDVFSQVLTGALARAAAGICLGVLIAAAAAHLLQPLVFETSPRDTATYVGVVLVLLLVAAFGAAIPARLAVRFDPAAALRQD